MKKLKRMLLLFVGLFLMMHCIQAKSSYYDNIWIGKLGEESNTVYGINDIVETENGFMAVGPYDTFGDFTPTLYFLDEKGIIKSSIDLSTYKEELAWLDVLRIIQNEKDYYILFESDWGTYDSTTKTTTYDNYILKLNNKGGIP